MPELYLPDEEATAALARQLAKELKPKDLVLLEGSLGAGKTTLVRALVEALGGDPQEVCSPTFILQESYKVSGVQGIVTVHHLDMYRLRGHPEVVWHEVGLGELLDEPGAVTAVEWPEDLVTQPLGNRVLRVKLTCCENGRLATWAWAHQ